MLLVVSLLRGAGRGLGPEYAGHMELDTAQIADAAAQYPFSGVVTQHVGSARVFEFAQGFANRGLAVPVDVDTQFGIASGSKGFTALAIMRLAEEGALRLDQPVREFLRDDLPLIDEAVTIGHLLEHTSGIGDYIDEDDDEADVADFVLTVPVHTLTTAESFIPAIDGLAQRSEAGAEYAYNNSGYVVLGIVLERVTGVRFQDAVTQLVLDPAGMTNSGFLHLNDLPGSVALGYLEPEGNLVNTLHLPIAGSADGGGFTTADDMHAFWCALAAGRIVTADTLDLMVRIRHEDVEDGLASGLGLYLHPSGRMWALSGYDAGQSFYSWHIPETQTTATVLGNTSDGSWGVMRTVMDHVLAEVGSGGS